MKQFFWFALQLLYVVALGENVTVSSLSKEFVDSVNTLDGPRRLAVNVPTTKFAREFTLAASDLLLDLMLEYHRQARLATTIVANEWKLCVSTLLNESSRVPSSTKSTEHLEPYLRNVCQSVKKFLHLQPGILRSGKGRKLERIPAASGHVLTHYENYEPEELFNNLEVLVDRDLTSIHRLVEKIYSKGWQGARAALGNLQQEFRDQFLHCELLNAWLEGTGRIDAASDVLRGHVKPETLREYEELSESLKLVGKTVRHDRQFCQGEL